MNYQNLDAKDRYQLMLQMKAELDKREMEKDLSKFIGNAWNVIEPGIEYKHNWHIDAICEYLEAVKQGQINRLIINMPPRYMKSIAITVMFPCWIWTTDPYKRFISVSYAAALSKKHNMNKRDIIQSPWYQGIWKDSFSLKDDMNTQIKFENDKTGFMFATSIGGVLTGEGGDIITIDDPHNPQQAESDAERESALEFCRTTLPTRLNDKKKGAIIVVMQRLHENDVSGYFLQQGGWEHLKLQGIADQRTIIHFPITNKDKIREEGDVLWPQREGKKEIDDMKKSLGSYGFSGQYQQEPSPGEGGMLKKQWWRYWKPKGVNLPPVTIKLPNGDFMNIDAVELPDYFDEQIQSWDCTFKDKDDSDFVAGGVWGRRLANYYLLDVINERMDIVQTIQSILQFSMKYPRTLTKLIEDKANGSAVIQLLRNKVPGLIPVNPEGGKIARASAVSPSIESGNVFLPHPLLYSWVNEFIDQCTKFPKGSHDDMVDMATQALNKLIYRKYNTLQPPTDPENPTPEEKYHNTVKQITGGKITKKTFSFKI
jgi:predicted phage terminase large subunit-like protein